MVKGERLFDKYSKNLELVYQAAHNKKISGRYICPLCSRYYSKKDLDKSLPNHLTVEHVPSGTLGGKGRILTCKECNNGDGSNLESHLNKQVDNHNFQTLFPGTRFSTNFVLNDLYRIGGIAEIDKNGKTNFTIDPKRTNPANIENIKELKLESVKFISPKFKITNAKITFLRFAYLYLFSEFGYAVLLNPNLRIVREMIQNPDKFPDFNAFNWHENISEKLLGVNIITKPSRLNSFYVILNLKKGNFDNNVGVLLPGSNKEGEDLYQKFNQLNNEDAGLSIQIKNLEKLNFIENKDLIFRAHNMWVTK